MCSSNYVLLQDGHFKLKDTIVIVLAGVSTI